MVMGLIMPAIVLAIIIIIVIIILGIRGGIKTSADGELSSEGGEEMIKTLYVYFVLFATLMMSIGGSVSAFMAVADLVAPTPYYQSYEDYRRWEVDRKGEFRDPDEQFVVPDEAEMQANYDSMVARERQREIGRARNSLIKSFGWILIPFGIFIFYQRHLVKSKA